MDFVISMRANPGDKHVSKATIKMYDAEGVDVGGQFLLEAETAETQLTMPPGGRCEITEVVRPTVLNPDDPTQAVLADLTPKDPLKDPNRPTATPQDDLKAKDPKLPPLTEKNDKVDMRGSVDSSSKDDKGAMDPMKRK